ncbi:MAG: hypothetical protein HS116_15135 [Planctomycetes bacterium]|nr:hypothetical protein [Planctomycetota bacterium]
MNTTLRDERGRVLAGNKLGALKRKRRPLLTEREKRAVLEVAKREALAGSGYHALVLVHTGALSGANEPL